MFFLANVHCWRQLIKNKLVGQYLCGRVAQWSNVILDSPGLCHGPAVDTFPKARKHSPGDRSVVASQQEALLFLTPVSLTHHVGTGAWVPASCCFLAFEEDQLWVVGKLINPHASFPAFPGYWSDTPWMPGSVPHPRKRQVHTMDTISWSL